MPSDWEIFTPKRFFRNSKHITFGAKEIYVSRALLQELGGPGYVMVQINRDQRAIVINRTKETNPAALCLTKKGTIRNAELTRVVLSMVNAHHLRMKGAKHSNGKSWVFKICSDLAEV